MTTRKKISILGSTGSIGVNTLDVIAQHPDHFDVRALAAGGNIALLAEQIAAFSPPLVSVRDEKDIAPLKALLTGKGVKIPDIVHGEEGAIAVATEIETSLVVSAFVGAAGLLPTLRAIDAGKDIALANKEVLVIAGELFIEKVKEFGVALLPVDSEHSAIFQCLEGNEGKSVRRILLTASGGPFRDRPLDSFATITIEEALNHPKWKMGPKITIDSATMMNKGLEVIEARFLFDQPADKIAVHIHPESLVHSMVEYWDGSIIAQIGVPDMRTPIAYALSHPKRLPLTVPSLDFFTENTLHFYRPDEKRFPALALAIEAARVGGSAGAVLNAANEIANEAFRAGRISFLGITQTVAAVLDKIAVSPIHSLEQILDIDRSARIQAEDFINKHF